MKKIALLMSVAILGSACSKTVKEIKTIKNENSNDLIQPKEQSDILALRTLLQSDVPNLALAELLARSISKEHQAELKSLIKDLSPEEASQIISKVQKDNNLVRNNYLFHGQTYGESSKFKSSVLMDEESLRAHPFSAENQLMISTMAYIKNKALNDIIETYNAQAESLANELSLSVAKEIALKHANVAKEIEEAMSTRSYEEVVKIIKDSKPVVEKIDIYFKTSELKENEQYLVILSGIIAGGIYVQIKNHKSFKNLSKEGSKVVSDVKEFHEKAKKLTCLVSTLAKHAESSAKNMKDLGDGISGARQDAVSLYEKIRSNGTGATDIHSRRIVDFLYKRVIKGEVAEPNSVNVSVLSKQISFNDNFKKSMQAASNLANNLNHIVATANGFAQLFKMKPSDKLLKVLDKAQKVNVVLQGMQSAVTGFASGGFLGAIGALSSGPVASLLGGGGSKSSAMLSEIGRKLDVVIENQQKIMSMQIETMKMIKDLALMIDIYHQNEMTALAELRDYALVDLELSKAQLNKDIRSCERMINYQLSSVWKNMDFGREAFNSITNLDLINARFTSSINSLNDIRRFMVSVEEDGLKNCQSGIAEAFGGNSYEENPIRSIFSINSHSNLFAFQRDTYRPLLASLEYFAETSMLDSMPLHLPSKDMEGLKYKIPHINHAKDQASSNENYDMTHLLSAKNLERYLGHLMVLLPVLEVDRDVWQMSYENIIGEYLKNSNSGQNQNVRSQYFLSNALKLTQSAIAQEALLAGEPILHKIHEKYMVDILSDKECDSIEREDVPFTDSISLFCSIRSNKLLMKNLVTYSLYSESQVKPEFFMAYDLAYKTLDKAMLAKLLNSNVSPERLVIVSKENEEQEIILNVKNKLKQDVAIKLPRPDDLKKGKIIYSENMARLIKMHEIILNGLEKVAPIKRADKEDDILKLLLVGI